MPNGPNFWDFLKAAFGQRPNIAQRAREHESRRRHEELNREINVGRLPADATLSPGDSLIAARDPVHFGRGYVGERGLREGLSAAVGGEFRAISWDDMSYADQNRWREWQRGEREMPNVRPIGWDTDPNLGRIDR